MKTLLAFLAGLLLGVFCGAWYVSAQPIDLPGKLTVELIVE